LSSFDQFTAWCHAFPYDYLFSVVNFHLLKPDLIRTARLLAINYHDGPLPRYAGSHATAWALHNGEREHGITWHVIEEKVDTGDVLKQVIFPIAADETLRSLDLKCFFAAVRAFRDLLTELRASSYSRTPQNLARRTFYRRCDKPS